MKRFVAFAAAIALLAAASIVAPDLQAQRTVRTATFESWGSYAELNPAAAANVLWVPGNRGLKMTAFSKTPGAVTVTIYTPKTAGPASATDSITVTARGVREWYGVTSDTMRVSCDSTSTVGIYY